MTMTWSCETRRSTGYARARRCLVLTALHVGRVLSAPSPRCLYQAHGRAGPTGPSPRPPMTVLAEAARVSTGLQDWQCASATI
jgi:hypothetical protein